MRFCYADPPYPGQSHRYYRDHPDYAGEVDHAALVAQLDATYPDGWALSTASRSIRDVLLLCPPTVRVGVWTKPMPPTRSTRAVCAWEPVIFNGGRPRDPDEPMLLDWVHAAPMRAYPGAITGTKPPTFSRWVFAMLNAKIGDELVDLFPGSGAVGHAWARDVEAGATRLYSSSDASQDAFRGSARQNRLL